MDALAAAAARQKPVNPATSPTPPPASPPPTSARPSALSINFLVESSSSPYFVEEDTPTNKPSDHVVVVDEQLQARTPNKFGDQHLDEVDEGDAGQDEASPTTTSAHRPSLFDHLHFSHQRSTPTPSSTTSSPPSTSSRNNSPTPLPGPCVVLPRPVRPNTSLSSALPAYPPLHHHHHHHHATTTATTAAAYPYPAYYPLASFANNPSAGPGGATTSSSTSSCSNASTLPPPVPMLTTPGAGPVIDLQFLSQLYLQASPYLLPGLFSTATATTSSSTSSSSSTTMSGGHHQAGVFAQSAAQQTAPPGYHPGIHLQQQVFHQAMALAHLHPLQHQHQQQQQQHISPPASAHREQSTALAPLTPARSLDGHVPNHQHHHNHQRHQSAGFSAGGDRMSALESILARAERHAQEENARNLARGVKREKSGYGDDYASPSRSDRLKRRRTDSNSSDSDYSPSSAGGQRRTQSDDDEHHHRGHPTFTSSSSGSSEDDEDDENGGSRRSGGKHQGVVGTGMREMLYKRRQASPKQVVLLEQVFAVEPIPTSATKLRLAEVLNMSPKRVTVWFKNKRARQKKKGIPLPNSCTTATATTATTSPGGPTTTTGVRTSPIDRKFPTSSASSSSSTTAASSSPPPARRRGDQHLTFHYFADRDGDDSAGPAP